MHFQEQVQELESALARVNRELEDVAYDKERLLRTIVQVESEQNKLEALAAVTKDEKVSLPPHRDPHHYDFIWLRHVWRVWSHNYA